MSHSTSQHAAAATSHRRPILACGLLLLLVTVSAVGCSRSFWRKNADAEVYALLPYKMKDPRWQSPRLDIRPDPRSRFYDPYPLDCGPLPPDDPAAHEYMHRVYGLWQSCSWHKFGTALSIENPHWLAPFGLAPTEQGPRPLGLDEALPDEGAIPPPAPAGAAADNAGRADIVRGSSQGSGPAASRPIGLALASDWSDSGDGSIAPVAAQSGAEADVLLEPVPDEAYAGAAAMPPQTHSGGYPSQFGIEDLTLQQALELSYIHSREYQTQIEELYLTALDLTFDRFQFNIRYLGIGGQEPMSDLTFESIPDGQNSLTMNNRFGVSQLFPSGAQLAVELANNTLWLFTGPNQTNTSSVLSYSLVQPLLMGAGRRVVLEGLTQRERNTLYAARDLARFRKLFFADVVANGPSGGFLGLLQQIQVVANQQSNIRQLEQQVEVLRALASQQTLEISESLPALPPGLEIPDDLAGQLRYDADTQLLYWRGDMTEEQAELLLGLSDDPAFQDAAGELVGRRRTVTVTLDVAQLESRLAGNRSALNQSQLRLQDSLDQFKIQLGLPPDLYLSIDDSLLGQFILIEAVLFDLEREITRYAGAVGRLSDENPDPAQLLIVADGLSQLLNDVDESILQQIDEDLKRVEENLDERLRRLETDEERQTVLGDLERDRRLYSTQQDDFRTIQLSLRELIDQLKAGQTTLEMRQAAYITLAVLRQDLLKVVQGLQVIQADLRVELIKLQEYNLGLNESVALGLENRVDLMNARARVMDARRKQEVAANQLEAVLDIVAEGDVRTPVGTNPFDFRGQRSSFRVGARFTAPLDQIAERNAYRVTLIDYQRARRDYMVLEDQVKFSIRQSWRQLQVLNENFEIARQALRLAATQLDLAVEEANAPGQEGQRATGQRGLNLLNALNSLLQAQNDLIGIWVDYERSRINIYRDMGMMEIDPRGVWTDPFYQQSPPSSPQIPHDP